MSNVMEDYFEALERLTKGKPTIVAKGTKITKDAVSMEAGRSKGSIKKSRPEFKPLINAIAEAAAKQKETPLQKSKKMIQKYKEKAAEYRLWYESALNRELMLVERVACLEKELQEIKKKNPVLKT